MDNLISEKRNKERADCNDYYTSETGDVTVHSIDELCANNDIDGGPANAGQNIENGNCVDILASWLFTAWHWTNTH